MNYVKELAERRKLLKIRMNNLLTAVDHSYGKPYYYATKNKNFKEINKIRDEIAKIDKKINFAINLKEAIFNEENNESNINFTEDETDSMGKR